MMCAFLPHTCNSGYTEQSAHGLCVAKILLLALLNKFVLSVSLV